jgi:hypothetical protein
MTVLTVFRLLGVLDGLTPVGWGEVDVPGQDAEPLPGAGAKTRVGVVAGDGRPAAADDDAATRSATRLVAARLGAGWVDTPTTMAATTVKHPAVTTTRVGSFITFIPGSADEGVQQPLSRPPWSSPCTLHTRPEPAGLEETAQALSDQR